MSFNPCKGWESADPFIILVYIRSQETAVVKFPALRVEFPHSEASSQPYGDHCLAEHGGYGKDLAAQPAREALLLLCSLLGSSPAVLTHAIFYQRKERNFLQGLGVGWV